MANPMPSPYSTLVNTQHAQHRSRDRGRKNAQQKSVAVTCREQQVSGIMNHMPGTIRGRQQTSRPADDDDGTSQLPGLCHHCQVRPAATWSDLP